MASSWDVEIKVNVAGDVDRAVDRLDLGDGKRREVWFLDDLTDGARPRLPLLRHGVILRLRRSHRGEEQSTVKLRPCRLSQLTYPWDDDAATAPDADYRIEGDWSQGRHVLAASCNADLPAGTIDGVLAGGAALSDAFSNRQRTFLRDCADIHVAFSGLMALTPIDAQQWKNRTVHGLDGVAAERWTVAGLDLLELSVRAAASNAARAQLRLSEAVRACGVKEERSAKSKTERVMKRLAERESIGTVAG